MPVMAANIAQWSVSSYDGARVREDPRKTCHEMTWDDKTEDDKTNA